MKLDPAAIPPLAVVHQEGVIGLIAVLGLAFRKGGPLPALSSTAPLMPGLALGLAVGVALAGLLWVLRHLPALASLEGWQRELVGGWSRTEAVGVAVLSGVAEEALARALLQPLVGLWWAALVFAVLHLLPDRRLWLWPVMALALGVVFGVVFEHAGYPACALSHGTVNLIGLLRLQRAQERGGDSV
jgi:membrane protease YdiL (CAAX protease family)